MLYLDHCRGDLQVLLAAFVEVQVKAIAEGQKHCNLKLKYVELWIKQMEYDGIWWNIE